MDRDFILELIARTSFMEELWCPKLSKKECVDSAVKAFKENQKLTEEKINDIVLGKEEYNIIYKKREELSDEVKKDIIKSVEKSKAEAEALKKAIRAEAATWFK